MRGDEKVRGKSRNEGYVKGTGRIYRERDENMLRKRRRDKEKREN